MITVTETKKTPTSKVGLAFKEINSGRGNSSSTNKKMMIIITNITDTSLFANSPLRVGQEIVKINETPIRGTTVQEVKSIMASLEYDVTIQAKNIPRVVYALSYSISHDNVVTFVPPPLAPKILKAKHVSDDDWEEIVETVSTELIPSVQNVLQLNQLLEKELDSYVGSQMVKGQFGLPGSESSHEKKVLSMLHQLTALQANANLAATNVLGQANALCNPLGFRANLAFAEKELPMYNKFQKAKSKLVFPIAVEFICRA